jgi:hypothetical protein
VPDAVTTEATPVTEAVRSVPSVPRPVQAPAAAEPEPINLLGVAGGAAASRFAVPAAGLAGLLLVILLLARRRRRRG